MTLGPWVISSALAGIFRVYKIETSPNLINTRKPPSVEGGLRQSPFLFLPSFPLFSQNKGDCQSPLQSRIPESKWGQICDVQWGERSQASSSCGALGQGVTFA